MPESHAGCSGRTQGQHRAPGAALPAGNLWHRHFGVAGSSAPRQLGQSMIEFLIILPSLLLIVFGVLQFALIYQARSALNHAAFVGARQGSLSNGNLTSIRDGVASGLAPLFMRLDLSATPTIPDLVRARLVAAVEVFNPNTAMVEILNPTPEAFNALNVGGVIPNDNLMYRTASGGGVSIQDANLLKVRVTYCFKLVVPFVNRMIYGLNAGLAEVRALAGVYFDRSGGAEPVPNLCSNINRTHADSIDFVSSMASGSSALAPLAGNLNAANQTALASRFPVIPALNWNVGGVRIPITAEATVRMQSPFAPSGAGLVLN